jgi:hypothetical protein
MRETKQILVKENSNISQMMHDWRAEWTDVKRAHRRDIMMGIPSQVAHLLLRNKFAKRQQFAIGLNCS